MIFAPQVSKFRLVTDATPSNQFPLSKILTQHFQAPIKDRIKLVRDLPMVEYKRQRQEIIPLFTSSGVFNPRNDSGIKTHSQIVCLDYDRLGDSVDTLKEQVSKYSFVYGAIKSLRGDGIKIFCKVDKPTRQQNHKAVYYALATLMNLGKVDSASALSQLCYFSVDESPYFNPACEVFPIPDNLSTEKEKQVDDSPDKTEFLAVDLEEVCEVFNVLKSFKNSGKFSQLMDGVSDSEDQTNSERDFYTACRMIFFYLKSDYWDGNQESAFAVCNKILNQSKSNWYKKSINYRRLTVQNAWNETTKTWKAELSDIQRDRQILSAISRRKNNKAKIDSAIWQCNANGI